MRASRAIAVALAVLVSVALATLWQAPPVAAAGGQSGSQSQQAQKPDVQKQVVTVHKQAGGDPVTVTVEKQAGSSPKVVTHAFQTEPMIAALGGGPRLGVRIRDLAKEDLAKFKLTTLNGVAVDEVTKDSAAEKAGVRTGDVVVQYDGENVRSAAQLTRLVRESVAGRSVKMGVIRDGKRVDLDVAPAEGESVFNLTIAGDRSENLEKLLESAKELGQQYRLQRRTPAPGGTLNWEEQVPAPGQTLPPGGALRWRYEAPPVPLPEGNFLFTTGRGRLGVTVQELSPELAAYFGVKDGLLVSAVQADSPASKAGIRAGDVIGSVNGKAVATPDELIKELADKEGEIAVGLTRDKKALSLKATLEPRKTPSRRILTSGRPA